MSNPELLCVSTDENEGKAFEQFLRDEYGVSRKSHDASLAPTILQLVTQLGDPADYRALGQPIIGRHASVQKEAPNAT
jgi:hypothetical protein